MLRCKQDTHTYIVFQLKRKRKNLFAIPEENKPNAMKISKIRITVYNKKSVIVERTRTSKLGRPRFDCHRGSLLFVYS